MPIVVTLMAVQNSRCTWSMRGTRSSTPGGRMLCMSSCCVQRGLLLSCSLSSCSSPGHRGAAAPLRQRRQAWARNFPASEGDCSA